jgi:steroid delta-isomerase
VNDIAKRVDSYYQTVSSGDIEAVLAMFAEAGIMRDPVGSPIAATDMERRQRYAGIGAMFDEFTITPESIVPGGDEAAARWSARGRTKTGRNVTFSGISTFVFDDDGYIAAMSAYWDPATVVAALQS